MSSNFRSGTTGGFIFTRRHKKIESTKGGGGSYLAERAKGQKISKGVVFKRAMEYPIKFTGHTRLHFEEGATRFLILHAHITCPRYNL